MARAPSLGPWKQSHHSAVTSQAKSAVLESGGAELLMKLLHDPNEICVLNTVKAIAEQSVARRKCKKGK